ncbi:carboxymuconolactone decarboxylase family protein [Herbiconiux sp. UC225_62]|uniref:carboxymuconolactone decarboxylase family protein n=1 Tax=Herbiconiux sp. UC225_62 TaxID=3350168 RepID=UPI0036D2A1EA
MSIIRTIPDSEATGLVAEQYERERSALGYVPSHARVMSVNPEAVAAWESLVRAIVASLGLRRYELITLAAARGTRSQHCRLAHGNRTLALGLFDEDDVVRIASEASASDLAEAGLSDAEIAMMAFAEKVSTDAASMTDADSLELRAHGFSDREIVDIALAAAVRNYYGKALQALAVEVDVPPTLSEPVREALVRGL